MNDVVFIIAVWQVIAFSRILTGAGMTKIAIGIRPYGWPLYLLGSGYLIFGAAGTVFVVVAIVRAVGGHNPAFEGIGYVGYAVILFGIVFSGFQALLVTYTAYRIHHFTPAEMHTVLQAAKVFAGLKQAVEAVKQ